MDKKRINFMHLNNHYLYPKMNDIKYLADKYPDSDILGLQETFLNDFFFLTLRYLEILFNFSDLTGNQMVVVLYYMLNLHCHLS